ncbi:hypothetical protein BDZ45DRAFT_748960 [Acephala macrosclerotiorum]|nr:hypothetical protein BDZ45DRAFT_748960 [Acephala macrosclerotiorum]
MINSPSHQHQHQHFSSSCRLTSHPTSRFSFNQSPTSNLQTHPFYSIIVKFSTSIILALAGTVISATPHSLSRRVADPTGVQDAITQWLADIAVTGNNFFNIAGNADPDAVADAMAVLPMTMDEPVQLMNLAGDVLPADTQAQSAIQELMTNFPTVPTELMAIAMSGGDQSVIQTQVNIIND